VPRAVAEHLPSEDAQAPSPSPHACFLWVMVWSWVVVAAAGGGRREWFPFVNRNSTVANVPDGEDGVGHGDVHAAGGVRLP